MCPRGADRPPIFASGLQFVCRGRGGRDLTASTLSGAEYREVWAEWLTKVFEGHPTDLVTLTFAPRPWECDQFGATGPTRSRVIRAADRFEKSLTSAVARPSWFMVREVGGMNGRAHLHSIVSDPELSSTRAAIASHAGKDGFVKLSKRMISPVEYVAKYVSKSDGDFWRAAGPLFVRVQEDLVGGVGAGRLYVGRARGSGEIRMDVEAVGAESK